MSKILFAGLAGLLTAACLPPTPPGLLAPMDPRLGVRPVDAKSVTSDLVDIRPASPKDWRDLNRAVTPKESGPSGGAAPKRHDHHGG